MLPENVTKKVHANNFNKAAEAAGSSALVPSLTPKSVMSEVADLGTMHASGGLSPMHVDLQNGALAGKGLDKNSGRMYKKLKGARAGATGGLDKVSNKDKKRV